MIRTFIFNEIKNIWIEEEEYLFFQDLCAFLEDDNSVIYLWKGPKCSKRRYKKAYASLNELISKYLQPKFQINVLAKHLPSQIEEKLNKMLITAKKQEESRRLKFSKFTTIRSYLAFSLIALMLSTISAVLLTSCLFWLKIGDFFFVSSLSYLNWLLYPQILILISLIMFILNTLVGLYEMETQVIVFSLIGLIFCSGILIYFQQGIYLFLFQEGSSSTLYVLKIDDIVFFWIIILSAITFFVLINLIKLFSFIRTYRKYIL
ncbi:MAG: hypothetical protein ACFFFB_02800 [Candidatus Heimdallarchaeota archaeon]